MNLDKEKQRLCRFAITILCGVCGQALADPKVLTLKELQQADTHTRVSTLGGGVIVPR